MVKDIKNWLGSNEGGWVELDDDLARRALESAYCDEIGRLDDELAGIGIDAVDGVAVVVGMPEDEAKVEGGV